MKKKRNRKKMYHKENLKVKQLRPESHLVHLHAQVTP